MERSIEIEQPSKSWWIKQLIIHLTLTLLITPFIFYILHSSGEGINNCLLYTFCAYVILSVWGIIDHYYNYEFPFSIRIFDGYIEVEYMLFWMEKKRIYTYEKIEVLQFTSKKEPRVSISKGTFLNNKCMIVNTKNGWTIEKQHEFVQLLKNYGVKVHIRNVSKM